MEDYPISEKRYKQHVNLLYSHMQYQKKKYEQTIANIEELSKPPKRKELKQEKENGM
jgi:hypothetical protein